MNEYELFDRTHSLFTDDINKFSSQIASKIKGRRVLVVGAAGTIGQATAKQFFYHEPAVLHAVDISENNLVELVRDIRSSFGYNQTVLDTFVLDVGNQEFDRFMLSQEPYDYILNLSALKHVRSEKDQFTLSRLISVNIFNSLKLADYAHTMQSQSYFCVSTDKAANPVNMMGASKRIMELYLSNHPASPQTVMARFANVAFSDGSLLHGFDRRLANKQPITAPTDVERYFVTKTEAGQICLLSALFGNSMDIIYPKPNSHLQLTKFSNLALKYLELKGLKPVLLNNEDSARTFDYSKNRNSWPCYFFCSDTTGEKPFEEFYTTDEVRDLKKFSALGVIKSTPKPIKYDFATFTKKVNQIENNPAQTKADFVKLFREIIVNFQHEETGKTLNNRM